MCQPKISDDELLNFFILAIDLYLPVGINLAVPDTDDDSDDEAPPVNHNLLARVSSYLLFTFTL